MAKMFFQVGGGNPDEPKYFLLSLQMHIDILGDVLYSDTTRQSLMFDMEGRIPENSEVTMAELKLFKKPLEMKHLPSRQSQRPVTNARVSVYWVELEDNGTNRTSLIDSRYEQRAWPDGSGKVHFKGIQYKDEVSREQNNSLKAWKCYFLKGCISSVL